MKKFFSIATIVVMLFVMALPAFAVDDIYPTPFPNISGVKSVHNLVLYDSSSGTYYLYQLAGIEYGGVRYKASISGSSVTYVGSGNGNVTFKMYSYNKLTDTDWVKVGTTGNYSSANAVSISQGDKQPIFTNFNIIDTNSDPFFLPQTAPMALRVICLARQAVLGNLGQLNQTVSILVLCGVGCLTLLISSVLLRKVFRIFRT